MNITNSVKPGSQYDAGIACECHECHEHHGKNFFSPVKF